ncbi:ferrochelatase [Syntrophotalea acetylenivorans]|uniref:Ferrochelatase n=1 Tax=Syntrophotalea acetylenivorans TaxID=1842532 RepID=A0A1L3GP13_9BACT|nr:ferrochelatase [Syntrophotalea acetylenivorans]APG27625.1 ferrochelatase [Syntrophotalea acetylenivorans]
MQRILDTLSGSGKLQSDRKTGLVLLNMGGPESLEDVEPYLCKLFSDRHLIKLPGGPLLQKPLARLLARRRAPKSREYYRQIGGKSPLRDWSERQATALDRQLGDRWKSYVLMRYSTPRAQEVLWQMRDDGIDQALVLPLYPQYAGATSGSSIADFQQAAAVLYPDLSYAVIPEWYDWPPYLDALVMRIREGLECFPADRQAGVPLLFSAHAMPQKVIDRGDPYLSQVLATVRGIMQRLPDREWLLGFQSRSGPVRWTGPSVTTLLDKLAVSRQTEVLLVPISFVSDHVETLYEIDIELQAAAFQRGIKHMVRSPSLNDHEDFIDALAELARHHLSLNCS